MSIIDANAACAEVFDVCVVGGGPAGLAVALDCVEAGMRTLIVEAGGLTASTEADPMFAAEIAPGSPHAPVERVCRRGLGGASSCWGRRCVPFDPSDFGSEDDGRWPVDWREMETWRARTARFLDCGDVFDLAPPAGWEAEGAVRASQHERWSPPAALARRVERLRDEGGPCVLLKAAAVGFEYEQAGGAAPFAVRAIRVRLEGRPATVRANWFVLACGGLETTRLLLSEQRARPALFGGPEGPLGRFYMGHLTGAVARLAFSSRDDARAFEVRRGETGDHVRRFLTLSPELRAASGIGNIGFWVDNPPAEDSTHGSAFLSLKHFAMTHPAIPRRLKPRSWPSKAGAPQDWRRFGANILADPLGGLVDLAEAARRRLVEDGHAPARLVRTRNAAYALRYHAEQRPSRESRVRLAEEADHEGASRLRIEYKVEAADARSVFEAHEALDAALRRSGKGRLSYIRPKREAVDHVAEQALDGFHQIGTTRMSEDPRLGVVDRTCRTHGFSNLFIASSSVFPTSGRANPTFMVVSLSLRLAAHLARLDSGLERRSPASSAGRLAS